MSSFSRSSSAGRSGRPSPWCRLGPSLVLAGVFATACGNGGGAAVDSPGPGTGGARGGRGAGGSGAAQVGDGGAAGQGTGGRAGGGSGGGEGGAAGAGEGSGGAGGADDDAGAEVGAGGGGGSGMGGSGPSDAGAPEVACTRMVMVENDAALGPALAAAKPGDCLDLADGQYLGVGISSKGTAAAPIVITARHRLKASFTSNVTFTGAAWVTVQGFVLPGFKITDALHCRLSRSSLKPGGGMVVDGKSDYARIDHNDIGGASIATDVMHPGGLSTNTLIDHNYFHDLHAPHTITLGCCGPTYDYHDTGNVAEYNLFVNCMSGAELFSIKSSSSTVRYNTVRMSQGDIDIRAGRKNAIYGNYIFNGTINSGIRMYEDGHHIFNNYVESGRTISVGPGHDGHAQVKDATIVFNTFVGPVRFGDDVNTVFANNIVTGPISNSVGLGGTAPITPVYKDNIVFPGPGPQTGFKVVDPKLTRMGELMVPGAGSPALGAAVTSFPFVPDDITGRTRGDKADIGAQQMSSTPALRHPLTAAEVGPDAP